MIENIGTTIYKGESIYNNGAGGGGSVIDYENGGIEKIGTYYYKVKKIQNRIWLCENFIENVGTTSYKYGTRYYSGIDSSINAIKTFLQDNTNWRLPTTEDSTDLLSITNKINLYDISWYMTNLRPVGFDIKKMGDSSDGGSSYNGVGSRAGFWLDEKSSSSLRYAITSYYNTGPVVDSATNTYYYNIRLCKDV